MNDIPPIYMPKKLVIYSFPLPGTYDLMYMRPPNNFNESDETIIFIDSMLFAPLWHDTQIHLSDAFQMPDISRALAKDASIYPGGKGFLEGLSNPVPLPEVQSIIDGKIRLEGKKRTTWLLFKQVRVIPMTCPNDFADQLNLLAGVK
jgi:hypothetical protein